MELQRQRRRTAQDAGLTREGAPRKRADLSGLTAAEKRELKNQRTREWRQANPEKYRESGKKWKAENRGLVAASERRRQAKQKDQIREQRAAYRSANKDTLAARNKAWRDTHKEHLRTYREGWLARRQGQGPDPVTSSDESSVAGSPRPPGPVAESLGPDSGSDRSWRSGASFDVGDSDSDRSVDEVTAAPPTRLNSSPRPGTRLESTGPGDRRPAPRHRWRLPSQRRLLQILSRMPAGSARAARWWMESRKVAGDPVDEEELRRRLRAALAALPPRDRRPG